MHFIRASCAILLLAVPASRAGATADQERPPAPASASVSATAPASASTPTPVAAPALSARFPQAAPEVLEQLRGGSESIASNTQLRGTADGNSATNVVTGNNVIASSFANAAGIPVVIQNSGANVLIQNATVVNLQFKSP
jgi:hypothetical protein